ncbi:hypothetical protein GCM10023206_07280 [Acinetobacter puyangensis]|uniref:Uncharacterized protein n=1 Tax=Acinetobacter puyangensis TaxID=1096779 RepID=A0A240E6G3_9GAMM|nr:hypothetical protein [Acinetobacter puyangensis]SNX44192.1 hypothetical protein SAMN05421731_102353 [Acinetobacter puyangensis]
MSKLKKRNKKFNPNKLAPSKVRELQQLAEYRKDIKYSYEMSMKFISVDVRDYIEDKKIQEKALVDRFPEAGTLPHHFVIGAYGYQDLAIALVLGHLKDPEQWNIDLSITLYDTTGIDDRIFTVNIPFTAPCMSHYELWKGKKDCYISRGNGLKTKGWDGLDNEIIKQLEDTKEIPDSFGIEKIEVEIKVDAKFSKVAAYREFLAVAEWVNTGVAEDQLRKLWIAEQVVDSQAKSFGIGEEAA